jgi:hypothetical protein
LLSSDKVERYVAFAGTSPLEFGRQCNRLLFSTNALKKVKWWTMSFVEFSNASLEVRSRCLSLS